MHTFVNLSIVFWSYRALHYRSSMSSNSLVFYTSVGISSSPAAVLFFIFLSTESSSSCVNCPSLMSNWLLMIFMIGTYVTFTGIPSKFWKCGFHWCIPFSWLVAFSLAFAVMYLYSCMHIMSIIYSIAEAVSSGSWSILLKDLSLNVTICIVRLHFIKFYFSLSSVAYYSKLGPWLKPQQDAFFFYTRE